MLARPRIEGLGLALLIAVVDRVVKAVMVGPLHLRERGLIELLPFFDLRYAENYGVSFGMFTADTMEMRWGLIGMTALIACGVLVWILRETQRGDILGLGMVLGGAIGNIYDRLTFGYVIDYADLNIGEWRPFQIFNLADVAITFGVLILLARSFKSREKPDETGDDTATENA
jgi:signal peptidase II